MAQINSLISSDCGGKSYRRLSTADTNAVSIKSSYGNVYSLMASNLSASDRFIKLYDKASAPVVGTDVPKYTFPIAGNAKTSQELFWHDWGKYFPNGIAIAITGAVGDSDTTVIGANEVVVNMVYM